MDPRKTISEKDGEFEVPKGLVEDLRAVFGRSVTVEPEVDESILAMARARFARRRPRVLVLRWAAGAAAAAACLMLALLLWVPARRADVAGIARHAAVAKEDFDRNGTVDVLDAFALARRIEAPGERRDEWDINGDGAVDKKDVDVIAMAAVSLEREALQ